MLCAEAYGVLYEQDAAVLAKLGHVWRRLEELSDIDPVFAQHLGCRDAVGAQLEDLAFFLRSYAAGIDGSPERLAEIESRLALLERLKKRYGPQLQDVLDHRHRIGEELDALGGHAEEMERLTAAADHSRRVFLEAAGRLSERRQRTAHALREQLARVLADLAMPHACVQARFRGRSAPARALERQRHRRGRALLLREPR